MSEDTYSARGEVAERLQELWPLSKRARNVGPEQGSNDEREPHGMSATFRLAGVANFDSWKKEVRVVGRHGPHIVLKDGVCEVPLMSSALQLWTPCGVSSGRSSYNPRGPSIGIGPSVMKHNACTSRLPDARRWKVVASGQCSEASFEKSDCFPIESHNTG